VLVVFTADESLDVLEPLPEPPQPPSRAPKNATDTNAERYFVDTIATSYD
jgi:hypothetical protein